MKCAVWPSIILFDQENILFTLNFLIPVLILVKVITTWTQVGDRFVLILLFMYGVTLVARLLKFKNFVPFLLVFFPLTMDFLVQKSVSIVRRITVQLNLGNNC